MVRVVDMEYGLAHTIGDTVYLNRRLPGKLRSRILRHELEHVSGAGWEIDWKEPIDLEIVWFVIRNPSAWVHYSPLWIQRGKLIYSKTVAMVWLVWLLGILIALLLYRALLLT